MNPNDPAEALVDFDRDHLNSLQEYQLEQQGKGTGPFGGWTLEPLNLPGNPVALNDYDDILVNGTNKVWVRNGTTGALAEISTVGGNPAAFIMAYDFNDYGQVVGVARHPLVNGNQEFGFVKDLWDNPGNTDVTPWYRAGDSSNPVKLLNGINNWGDVIGLTSDFHSFVQNSAGLISVDSDVMWEPLYKAINEWGLALGVPQPGAAPDFTGHTLTSPTWNWSFEFPLATAMTYGWELPTPPTEDPEDPAYQEYFEDYGAGAYFQPSLMNEWGEFAGEFRLLEDYEPIGDGSWYFDGTGSGASLYRQLLPPNYLEQRIIALNDWPQMLITGRRIEAWEDPETTREGYPHTAFLHTGGISVQLAELFSSLEISEFDDIQGHLLNNRSTVILSYPPAYPSPRSFYMLRLNNDRDGDGMPNDWEEYYGFDPDDVRDAGYDSDNDGFNNLSEFRLHGNPLSRGDGYYSTDTKTLRPVIDSDGDGLPDTWERRYFPSLTLAACVPDADPDLDLLTNFMEWSLGTDPTNADTDSDGLNDGVEFLSYRTDPTKPDTDDDGINDAEEVEGASDPNNPSSLPAPLNYLRVFEKIAQHDTEIHFTRTMGLWSYDAVSRPGFNVGMTYAQLLAIHDGQNFGDLVNNPSKIYYDTGNAVLASDSPNTDGQLGGGFPRFHYSGSSYSFTMDSWLVRAARAAPHPSRQQQDWLLTERDTEWGGITGIETFRQMIEPGETQSVGYDHIRPSGNFRGVTVEPLHVRPQGSASQDGVPTASWDPVTARFDFQGVIASSAGPYVIPISVSWIYDATYLWELGAGAGSLTGTDTTSPGHLPPATPGVGRLKLDITLENITETIVDRSLKIYRGHLERDRENFGINTDCGGPGWTFTAFGTTISMPNAWNCHGSVVHHHNGTGNGYLSAAQGVPAPISTWGRVGSDVLLEFEDKATGPDWAAAGINLQRGDVIVYILSDSLVDHSQMVLSGTTTYCANNTWSYGDAGGGNEGTWMWSEDPAGKRYRNWPVDEEEASREAWPIRIQVYRPGNA